MDSGQKFAHQHVESAVAAQCDHLARAIQHLHPVGLTERRSYGRVVEGTYDPLRPSLADPVAGPKRVQTGVEDEYRIGPGEIAHSSGHSLRMDAILAARGISLLVQHLVPLASFFGYPVPEAGAALWRDPTVQQLQGRSRRTRGTERGRCAPPEHPCPFVDLDDIEIGR